MAAEESQMRVILRSIVALLKKMMKPTRVLNSSMSCCFLIALLSRLPKRTKQLPRVERYSWRSKRDGPLVGSYCDAAEAVSPASFIFTHVPRASE